MGITYVRTNSLGHTVSGGGDECLECIRVGEAMLAFKLQHQQGRRL